MKIEGYSLLSTEEKDVLHALLERGGIKVRSGDIVDAPSDVLGIDWCKIICSIKGALAVAACGRDPICIAQALATAASCVKGCK
jgi:hypothetical protein